MPSRESERQQRPGRHLLASAKSPTWHSRRGCCSSHHPAATTGLNDACAVGKGGLRKQGGDRPAPRQKQGSAAAMIRWIAHLTSETRCRPVLSDCASVHEPTRLRYRRALRRRSDHASARRREPKAIVHRGVTGWSALGHPARPSGEPLPPCLDSDCPSTARARPALWCPRVFRVACRASWRARSPHTDAHSVLRADAQRRPGRKVGGDQGGVQCHRPRTGPRSVACFRWSSVIAVAAGCAGCSARSPRTRGCSAPYRRRRSRRRPAPSRAQAAGRRPFRAA
jgi:hypothetical protein